MSSSQSSPERFYSLDILRGIAALCVVFWHYQHFFFVGDSFPRNYNPIALPFYDILCFFFTYGSIAVNFFFSLSGFIFYWLYSKPVSERTISAKEFFVRRFSRIYPLHLLTLLWVSLGQFAYHHFSKAYFIYQNNDPYHFVLSLFLATGWAPVKGESFNGPSWSISVEEFMYLLFFLFCRVLPVNMPITLGMVFYGFFLASQTLPLVGEGITSFFIGGCVYLVYKWLVERRQSKLICRILFSFTLLSWLFTAWALKANYYKLFFHSFFNYMILFLIPLTILGFALMEKERGSFGKRFAILGDISYSSYLLHFPLELTIATILVVLGHGSESYGRSWFYSPFAFIGFIALVSFAGLASYRYFERPVQRVIRKNWIKPCAK